MFKTGKCPGCESIPQNIKLEGIEISEGIGAPVYNGVSYVCPTCHTILGVQLDPIAIQTDTVKDIGKLLRGSKR